MENNNDQQSLSDCKYDRAEKRGKALIFNMYNYKKEGIESRDGSEFDVAYLEDILKKMQFEVEIHDRRAIMKNDFIKKTLKRVANEPYTNKECLMVIFMAHGSKNNILGTYDSSVKLEELYEYFSEKNNPSLAGKPKIFFIQACRSPEDPLRGSSESEDKEDEPPQDFFIGFCTKEGELQNTSAKGQQFQVSVLTKPPEMGTADGNC